MVKLTWVVDDVGNGVALRAEHGFAMWIETAAGQVLFDTGGSGETLLHNLDALGLDPRTLDAVVLSHGHDDHTGGLAALVAVLAPGTPVYGHETLFRPRYSRRSGELEDRGLRVTPSLLSEKVALHLSRSPVEVLPGVWTTGEIAPRPDPEGRSRWHVIPDGDGLVADPYEDDLSLVVDVGAGRSLLVCGCCHAGLLNTLRVAETMDRGRIIGIAGGVHLANAPAAHIDRTVDVLWGMPDLRHLWLGHCSGEGILAAARSGPGHVVVETRAAGHSLTFDEGQLRC